jgi:hypothetical protein
VPEPGAAAAPGAWTRLFRGRPRDEALAVAFVLWGVWFVYLMLIGGDYEPTARFVMPVLALLLLSFQEALRSLVLLVRARAPAAGAAAVILLLAGGIACLVQSEQRHLILIQSRGWPHVRKQHHEDLRGVGEWLHANTPPGTLVAVSSIGALPYFADRPVLDMMGLTEPRIGRMRMATMGQGPAGHEKGDGAYVLSRRPDVILFDKGHFFTEEASLQQVLAGARGISELEIAGETELVHEYELRRARLSRGVLHYFARREGALHPNDRK